MCCERPSAPTDSIQSLGAGGGGGCSPRGPSHTTTTKRQRSQTNFQRKMTCAIAYGVSVVRAAAASARATASQTTRTQTTAVKALVAVVAAALAKVAHDQGTATKLHAKVAWRLRLLRCARRHKSAPHLRGDVTALRLFVTIAVVLTNAAHATDRTLVATMRSVPTMLGFWLHGASRRAAALTWSQCPPPGQLE